MTHHTVSLAVLLLAVCAHATGCGGQVVFVEDDAGGRGTGAGGAGAHGSGAHGAGAQGEGGASGGCNRDADCELGEQWCQGGACIPCDNGGEVCDIDCQFGWSTYQRNGCTPCDCAPPNQCIDDGDCGDGGHCYAGAFCWEGCGAGDPGCCQGNICSAAGCPDPPPVGCVVRGCPMGDVCDTFAGCASSGCSCGGSFWGCDDDCSGGVCLTPL